MKILDTKYNTWRKRILAGFNIRLEMTEESVNLKTNQEYLYNLKKRK